MLIGVDTGFFFFLESQNPVAVEIWRNREIVTSTIVLYEIQKKLLHGHFKDWPTIIQDIRKSLVTVPLTTDIALRAAHLAYGTGMPGLDALILASLLDAGCEEIYTTDQHFEAYQKRGIKIINLRGDDKDG